MFDLSDFLRADVKKEKLWKNLGLDRFSTGPLFSEHRLYAASGFLVLPALSPFVDTHLLQRRDGRHRSPVQLLADGMSVFACACSLRMI